MRSLRKIEIAVMASWLTLALKTEHQEGVFVGTPIIVQSCLNDCILVFQNKVNQHILFQTYKQEDYIYNKELLNQTIL